MAGLFPGLHPDRYEESRSGWRSPPITANHSIPDVFTKAERSDVMSRICSRASWEHEGACTIATFRSAS